MLYATSKRLRILSSIRDQRRETRKQLKSCETREVPYTYIAKTELGIKCPLVYSQA